jgi:hypothetical protein
MKKHPMTAELANPKNALLRLKHYLRRPIYTDADWARQRHISEDRMLSKTRRRKIRFTRPIVWV